MSSVDGVNPHAVGQISGRRVRTVHSDRLRPRREVPAGQGEPPSGSVEDGVRDTPRFEDDKSSGDRGDVLDGKSRLSRRVARFTAQEQPQAPPML